MTYAGRHVLVAGAEVTGTAAARALLDLGARVTATDRAPDRLERLRTAGADVATDLGEPPAGTDLVVTSPGWRPDHPLLRAATASGVEVIGEVELAWRIGAATGRPVPWLALTGTNGKTTTVRMLESILRAGGCRAVAAGNVGLPVIEAVRADPPYDVLAVELSSFQLHWSSSLRPRVAALLNLAPDHIDWHGSMAAYAAEKARILGADSTNVVNADDPAVLAFADGTAVGFTLGDPGPGQVGLVGDRLVDRAFADRLELAEVADVRPPGPHNLANALAAAAMARAHGLPAEAVRDGLRTFVPDAHRGAVVGEVAGVRYVDDSKATNPHAAAASLAGYDRVVWVAGGRLKGADVDDLVAAHRHRLRGAVLLGADRAVIATSIARHAPDVPVLAIDRTDDDVMGEVVARAAEFAQPGDTVLLAPAADSLDMFANYGARGDAFATAVHALTDNPNPPGHR